MLGISFQNVRLHTWQPSIAHVTGFKHSQLPWFKCVDLMLLMEYVKFGLDAITISGLSPMDLHTLVGDSMAL